MLAAGRSMSGSIIKGIDPVLSPKVLELEPAMRLGRVEDLDAARGRPTTAASRCRHLRRRGAGQEAQAQDGRPRARGLAQDRPRSVALAADGGGRPRASSASPAIFYTGFEEYDSRLAYVGSRRRRSSTRGRATWSPASSSSVDDIDDARDDRREALRRARRPALSRDRLGGAQPQPVRRAAHAEGRDRESS